MFFQPHVIQLPLDLFLWQIQRNSLQGRDIRSPHFVNTWNSFLAKPWGTRLSILFIIINSTTKQTTIKFTLASEQPEIKIICQKGAFGEKFFESINDKEWYCAGFCDLAEVKESFNRISYLSRCAFFSRTIFERKSPWHHNNVLLVAAFTDKFTSPAKLV